MGLSFKERLALQAAKDPSLQPKMEPTKDVSQETNQGQESLSTQPKQSRFGSPKACLDNIEAASITVPEEAKALAINLPNSTVDLGKVIQAHNTVANKSEKTVEAAEVDPLSGVEASSVVKELQQRIAGLSSLEDGTELRGEVGLLKTMITSNGDACRYLLDEDLGLFVRALRRMTDNKVAQDMGRAKPSAKAKAKEPTLSMQDVAALMSSDDLDFSL